jgi:Glutathione S-transferase, C-terminal domain
MVDYNNRTLHRIEKALYQFWANKCQRQTPTAAFAACRSLVFFSLFVFAQLTWADLHLLNLVGWLDFIDVGSQITEHEKLNALYQRVKSEPKVAAWLEKRPKTPW